MVSAVLWWRKFEYFKIKNMYIPGHNKLSDKTKIVSFLRRFSFATIITSKNDIPIATHLPFLIEEKDDQLFLHGHFAKQNEQWKDIENSPVLVIFHEPHAYVSPTNYEKERNVPTWNYIAVHAYGKGHLITEHDELLHLLEETIHAFETSYMQQWNQLPEKYRSGQMEGIVGFKIEITELQAKEKLSQNKTVNEQKKIIASFSLSNDTNHQLIAEYMKQHLPGQ